MAPPARVILRRNRTKPVIQRHPWVFSGAIERIEGDVADGEAVDVCDIGGAWLARGTFNSKSQIAVRLLTWRQDETIDRALWQKRLAQAIEARGRLAGSADTTAYRLVHAESDFLPGLMVDRYGDWLVVQFLTAGVEKKREEIAEVLAETVSLRGIYERSDVDARAKEGLERRRGLLWGETPPPELEISENGRRFLVDLVEGHKTGFYLDQRENRSRLPLFCAGADVLDAFAYTGGFGVYAATGGAAHVTMVDSSGSALELARRNVALNRVEGCAVEYVDGDFFSVARNYRAEGRRFDAVVLDPPKLAHSRGEVERAARAYKDANLLAFELLRPNGVLFTFSCSGAIHPDLFQKIVFGAALDAGRDAQIVCRLAQGEDHPVALSFPEGAYLKGLIVRVPG